MNEIKFSCPHCDQHLQAAAANGGRQLQCPSCNHLIHVPVSSENKAQATPQSGMTWDTFIPARNDQ